MDIEAFQEINKKEKKRKKETVHVLGFVTLVVCIALPAFFFQMEVAGRHAEILGEIYCL